mmetsp:Transcript_38656/g.65073  ORF Transcript_38656/g.65073 Transcript_38656/m.65073 type:complete len:205 (+) Transcript_38656:389-1003(+)
MVCVFFAFLKRVCSGRSISKSPGTIWYLVASGLNSGVSMNCRKRLATRRRRPSMDRGSRPRFSRSASRSISSTVSRVRLQSNSFTVHFTCSSTSSRSSVVSSGNLRPLYSCMSSFARVVNGVCTSTPVPSLISHALGAAMSLSVCAIRTSRFSALAAILSLSMVCRSLVSLCSSCRRAARRSPSRSPASLIFCVSCRRQASSSL